MTDLTDRAVDGFRANHFECPYIYSSASAIAWQLGLWFQQTGRPEPKAVKMSRGYSIRSGDMLFAWKDNNLFERLK